MCNSTWIFISTQTSVFIFLKVLLNSQCLSHSAFYTRVGNETDRPYLPCAMDMGVCAPFPSFLCPTLMRKSLFSCRETIPCGVIETKTIIPTPSPLALVHVSQASLSEYTVLIGSEIGWREVNHGWDHSKSFIGLFFAKPVGVGRILPHPYDTSTFQSPELVNMLS